MKERKFNFNCLKCQESFTVKLSELTQYIVAKDSEVSINKRCKHCNESLVLNLKVKLSIK